MKIFDIGDKIESDDRRLQPRTATNGGGVDW